MADIEITRKQIIVVDKVGEDDTQYGKYLTWTDKEGKSYRVKPARREYFEDAIVSGRAVEVSFAKYRGTEYPYSAVAIQDKLPTEVPINPKVEALEAVQMAKAKPVKFEMSKEDWAEKDRITRKSIERQTSLNAAVALAGHLVEGKLFTGAQVIATAKLFEAYLEGNKLVEEAKRLGATEIRKED